MLYATINTKGGVGKTTTAIQMASVIHKAGRQFKVVELDDDVNSMLFDNSDFLTTKNSINLKLDQKSEVMADVLFDAMSSPKLDYILDIGAGNNVHEIIESLKSLKLQKTYLIPVTSDKKYLQNGISTFKLIDDSANTVFVLNKVQNPEEFKKQFLYFFGDSKLGIKPVSPIFTKTKYVWLPDSNFYQIAEDEEQSLLDLAMISYIKNPEEARKEFFEIAKGSRETFHILWLKYEKSIEAAKVFDQIQEQLGQLV